MKEGLGCLLEPSANSAFEPWKEHQQRLSHQWPERMFFKSLPSQGYVQHYTGIVSCLSLSSLMKLVLIVQGGIWGPKGVRNCHLGCDLDPGWPPAGPPSLPLASFCSVQTPLLWAAGGLSRALHHLNHAGGLGVATEETRLAWVGSC